MLLREESSGCVCRTVQKKEREEGPKLGQWQWEEGGEVGGGVTCDSAEAEPAGR